MKFTSRRQVSKQAFLFWIVGDGMGAEIKLKCDLCPKEETFMWGEKPDKYGWEANRNYCLCPDCNHPQFDDHAQGQEEKAAHIEAVQRLMAA